MQVALQNTQEKKPGRRFVLFTDSKAVISEVYILQFFGEDVLKRATKHAIDRQYAADGKTATFQWIV